MLTGAPGEGDDDEIRRNVPVHWHSSGRHQRELRDKAGDDPRRPAADAASPSRPCSACC